MQKIVAHYPKTLALLALIATLAALIALPGALTSSACADKGFILEGNRLIIKKGFIAERGADNTVTVRRRTENVATGKLPINWNRSVGN